MELERIVVAPRADIPSGDSLPPDPPAALATAPPSLPAMAERETFLSGTSAEHSAVVDQRLAPPAGQQVLLESPPVIARAPVAHMRLSEEEREHARSARPRAPREMPGDTLAIATPLPETGVDGASPMALRPPPPEATSDRAQGARAMPPAPLPASTAAPVEVHIGAIEITLQGRVAPPPPPAPDLDPAPQARSEKRETRRFAFHPGRHHLRWS